MRLKCKLFLLILFLVVFGGTFFYISHDNSWKGRLYSPTELVKYGNDYFIVDAWHHRIIYNDKIDAPIEKWKTMTDSVLGCHSIASNGHLFVVDDTDHDALRIFKKRSRGGVFPMSKNRRFETQTALLSI